MSDKQTIASKCLQDYVEARIVFSLRYLSKNDKINKKKLVKDIDILYRKFDFIQFKTWKNWTSTPKENGISFEKPDHKTFEMVNTAVMNDQREKNKPFHFRINQKYRVFGIQIAEFCMITHIDPNHKYH